MKELSIEQKAKRYDKAIERARTEYKNHEAFKGFCEMLVNIFPELKESEDEQIRKRIIQSLHGDVLDMEETNKAIAWLEKQGEQIDIANKEYWRGYREGMEVILDKYSELEKQGENDSQVILPQFTFDDILALQCCMETVKKVQEDKDLYEKLKDLHGRVYDAYHFEKQGEQNPVDKIEPKFKTGQWIVWQDKCYKVNYNGCGYELVDQNGLSTSLEYGTVNENAHLWDITKDAKEGDILVIESGRPFIFKGCLDKRHPNSPVAYCGIDCGDDFHVSVEISWWADGNVFSATKEQRDFLFQEMREAGYEWDAVKKQLKKL